MLLKATLIFIGRATLMLAFVTLPVLLIVFSVLEVFARIGLNPSETPRVYFDQELGIMYEPDQKGTYIKGGAGEINASYRINNLGWNSPHDYRFGKDTNIKRVAVIGDSFIEAFQTDFDQSFPYLVENKLQGTEFYTFGHSGSSLAQYIQYLRYAKENFSPDFYVISLVDNDFEESFCGYGRTDNWSVIESDGGFKWVKPQEPKNFAVKKILGRSAFIRYLTVNLDFINSNEMVRKLFYLGVRNSSDGVDIPVSQMDGFVGYAVSEIDKLTEGKAVIILNSNSDYKNPKYDSYREMVKTHASANGLTILDLEPVFNNESEFIWPNDYHWNQRGHQEIAEELLKLSTKERLFPRE